MSEKKFKFYPDTVNEAKIVELIQVVTGQGAGTEDDPHRRVTEFYTKEGYLVAIDDPNHSHERMDWERQRGM